MTVTPRSAKPRRRIPHRLQEQLDDFIEMLARTGSVTAAAEAAGLGRTQVYERRRTHKRFADAWKKALSLAEEVKPGASNEDGYALITGAANK